MSHCSARLRTSPRNVATAQQSLPPLPLYQVALPQRRSVVAQAAAPATLSPPLSPTTKSRIEPSTVATTDTFLSRYVLGDGLGKGASGQVFAGAIRATGQEVAIKVVAKHPNASRHQRSALNREAALWRRACAATRQAVQFISIEEDTSNYYIVSEKCHGGSLQQLLDTRGVLTEAELSQVAWCVLTFLSDMHENSIYYGDLKPGNVILKDIYPCNADPGCLSVRVVDFGCSQLVTDGTPLRALAGSPLFLAPEILAGAYGLPADMWALGCTLYMMISNRLPFWLEPIAALEGQDVDSINLAIRYNPVLFAGAQWRGVSEQLKDLICGLLEKDPQRRLTAARAMEHPWFAEARESCAM